METLLFPNSDKITILSFSIVVLTFIMYHWIYKAVDRLKMAMDYYI